MANKSALITLTHVVLSEQMDKFDRDTLKEFEVVITTAFNEDVATNITNGILEIVTGINKTNDKK